MPGPSAITPTPFTILVYEFDGQNVIDSGWMNEHLIVIKRDRRKKSK